MNIRLISTLTEEVEDRIAALLLSTVRQVLDHLTMAYAIRIETTGGKLLEHVSSAAKVASRAEDE